MVEHPLPREVGRTAAQLLKLGRQVAGQREAPGLARSVGGRILQELRNDEQSSETASRNRR